MSDHNNPVGAEVDPSEGALEEGEQQSVSASEDESEESAMLEVDPSEGPTE